MYTQPNKYPYLRSEDDTPQSREPGDDNHFFDIPESSGSSPSANPYLLDDEELSLIDKYTRPDNADRAGALRMRTYRDQHRNNDFAEDKPTAPSLLEVVSALPPRDDDDPLLDQKIADENEPIDWQLVRQVMPFLFLCAASGVAFLFVVLPTLISIHNAGSFTVADNLSWWPILAALLGIGLFAWREEKNALSCLFSGDVIIISTWY